MFFVAFSCHGFWEENGTSFLIASPIADNRKSTDPHRYCFIFDFNHHADSNGISVLDGTSNPLFSSVSRSSQNKNGLSNNENLKRNIRFSAIADNCHRISSLSSSSNHNGMKHGWTMNLTTNGKS